MAKDPTPSTREVEPTSAPRSPTLYRWLSLLASTLVCLAITELALRFVKPNRAFQPDPDLIRSLAPNSPGRMPTFETEAHLEGRSEAPPGKPGIVRNPTNNVGFRMTEDIVEKTPAERRVLVLGDSYTEAYQVNAEERFVDIAARTLAEDPSTRHWRVLNGGVENGCPSQYSLQLKRWLDRFKPEIVIVALAPNDLADDYAYDRWYGYEYDGRGMPSGVQARRLLWWLQKSYLLRYTEAATLTGSPSIHAFLFPDAKPEVPAVMWQELACANDHRSKELFRQRTGFYLRGLKNMVEEAGAKLGVSMVQYLYFFENEKYYKPFAPSLDVLLEKYGCYRSKGLPYQGFIEDFLRASDIEFDNPYTAFVESEQRAPQHKLWNYFDYHYSPAGHRIMADSLLRVIRRLMSEKP